NNLYINIPKRFDPETLSYEEMVELIQAKVEKEANRYIHQWNDEGIAVENGRWGPFIRFKKKSIKIPKNEEGKRMTPEEAKEMTLEDVKQIITAEIPDAFATKKKAKPKAKKATKAKTTKAKK
ncbi:MAG: topoisomerase C-terminal repeat-containing protein, partial [Bacteroidota bacterium]